jgi:hypothetical protein
VTSDRDVVHHKRRKRHNNQLLRRSSRLRKLNRSVTSPGDNANNGASSRNNVESIVVRRKLNVRQDPRDNNNHKANALQHQLDRSRNRSNNDAWLFHNSVHNHRCVVNQHRCGANRHHV